MKQIIVRFHWVFASQFGLDPLRFLRSLRNLPRFVRDWVQFRSGYRGRLVLMPCLHDRLEEGGITKSEYFWQDLMVARWICNAKPERHVDIGSRIDGFVAHVASFRKIEVFDVRPVTTNISGVTFTQADLMDAGSIAPLIAGGGYCDSLSCLHALEHFGLGRYGDSIDPRGYERGMANLAALLKPDGRLYLSTPVGQERVLFNANWVFAPQTILQLAAQHDLHLERLHIFRPGTGLEECAPADFEPMMAALATEPYQLVVMQFIKTTASAA